MTECTTQRIRFSGIKRRQIVADFNGGRLTTDAGVLLLREVDRQIGLIDAINQCFPDPRDPRYTIHQQREMIAQRIFSIALGYEDLNDQQTLRDDPALQIAAGKVPEAVDGGAVGLRSPAAGAGRGKVGTGCGKAVPATEQGTKSVNRAGEVVTKAGETITTLAETLSQSARTATQISASANQQAAGVAQMSNGIKNIDNVTNQNVQAIQEIKQAAQDLNALSTGLAELTAELDGPPLTRPAAQFAPFAAVAQL